MTFLGSMGSKIRVPWLPLFTFVVLTSGGCALQDDVVIVDKRLMSLGQRVSKQEKAVESLRAKLSQYHQEQTEANEAFRDSQADLRALTNDLREDVQILRGQLEELGHLTRQKMGTVSEEETRRQAISKQLEQSIQASLDRIVALEAYLGMEPSEKMGATGSRQAVSQQAKTPEKKTPEALYAQAKGKFDRGEYDTARELFQAFLKKHPKSDNADNAQFWVGEVYYREKWYEKAILEYQKVIEGYPKGNKIRSALLKQGFAFLNLGDKDNARLILKELVRKYPDSSEAKIAKEKLSKLP
jgi:tol-pal system protein YbgF